MDWLTNKLANKTGLSILNTTVNMDSSKRLVQYSIVTYLLIFPEVIQGQSQRNAICKKLSEFPNFNLNAVVDGTWRFYYTWVLDMRDSCLDMTFVRASRKIIDRIGMGMNDYMREKIVWNEATMMTSLVKTVGSKVEKPREMLLFPEKGNPGGFQGVPNLHNAEFHVPKYSVQTSHEMFKLLREGKFLVMAECDMGVAVLMARVNQTVYRSEILSLAEEIWPSDDGFLSCMTMKNENEIEGVLTDLKDLEEEANKNM